MDLKETTQHQKLEATLDTMSKCHGKMRLGGFPSQSIC